MSASMNASIPRTLGWGGLVAKCVYTWILFAYWAQLPKKTACDLVFGVPPPLSESTSITNEYSTREEENRPELPAPWNQAPLLRRALSSVYGDLLSLRDEFSAQAGMANHGSQAAKAVYDGQDVVVGFLPAAVRVEEELSREDIPNPKYRPIIPEGESLTMVSAATGMTGQYTFVRDHAAWILRGPDGERYQFRLWPLDSGREQDGFGSRRALEMAEEIMTLPMVFRLPSIKDVEDKFHVPVFRDILTHASGQPDLSFPAGRVLNFITLWKPTVVNLKSLARAIDLHGSSSPELREAATIARYNLTYQVIRLIGQITHHGVILRRFGMSWFRVDQSGVVDFVPTVVPKRAEWMDSSSHQLYNSVKDAKDLGFVVFYLWCPLEALEILSPKEYDQILTRALRCPSMSEDVWHILQSIFIENKSAEDVVHSNAFRNIYLRLRQVSQERVARLTQKSDVRFWDVSEERVASA